MKRLELTDSLMIGHAEIDVAHALLVSLANDYGEALEANDTQACEARLDDLGVCLEEHFECEERVMGELRYDKDKLSEHRKVHEIATKNFIEIDSRCMECKHCDERCFFDVVHFLFDDLVASDLAFKGYLQEMNYQG